jgi:hypothetical protein
LYYDDSVITINKLAEIYKKYPMKTIILAFFLLINTSAICQVAKFKSFEAGISKKINGYFYSPKFKNEENIIIFDTKQGTLSFYGQTDVTMDIYKNGENYHLKNGDEILEFYCIDNQGRKCLSRLKILKNPDPVKKYTYQISLEYDNLQFIFNGI